MVSRRPLECRLAEKLTPARVMRRTGRLYTLTLVSCAMTVVAASMVAAWDDDTAAWHLWLDIVPQGLGMASVITTTLIVSALLRCRSPPSVTAGLAGDDRKCGQGGPRRRNRKCVLLRTLSALPD